GLDRAQSEPALEGVNPGEVPAAEDGIDKWARAVSVSAPLPEGDLPNVADHSALLDVEFRQPMLGFDVEWILRLSKRPDVEAGADAAGREVVRRVGQRFPVGVAAKESQSARIALLKANLQRLVIRVGAVLHELNVAELREGPRAAALRHAGGIDGKRLRVDVAEAGQFRSLIAHVRHLQQQVLYQLALDAEVVLLDIGRALIGVLSAPPDGGGQLVGVKQSGGIPVLQTENRVARRGVGLRDGDRVVNQEGRIEAE